MQIDTIEKTIIFEEAIELEELFKTVKAIFPDNTWKSYKLISKIITDWMNPIIISNPVYPQYPILPLNPWNPPIYATTNVVDTDSSCHQGIISGVFNLEFNN